MSLFSKNSHLWLFLSTFTVLTLVVVILCILKNPIAIDDGLRHYAYGKLMMGQGIYSTEWSQLFDHGYLSMHTVDPWFLSNILFGLLSFFGPVITPKAFALLSIFSLLGLFLWFFRTLKTPPFIASILLFMLIFFDPMFYVRLLLGRPYELVTVFTFLGLFSAIRGKMLLLGVAMVMNILLSQLFIFPLILIVGVIVWKLSLHETKEAGRLTWTLVISLLLGIGLHPHPFEYISYLFSSFLRIPFLPHVQLGMEMQSGLGIVLRVWLVLAFTLLLILSFLRFTQDGIVRFHKSGLSYLSVISFIFSALFFRWSRAIDIAWPLVILVLTILLSESPGLISAMLDRVFFPSLRPLRSVCLALLLGSCFLTWIGTSSVLASTDDSRSLTRYEEGLSSIPLRSHILNVDWHLFAPMVAVRPDLHYTAGIDPSYTYLVDPKAHELLAMLSDPEFGSTEASQGLTVSAWLTALLHEYPSHFLVIERARHPALVDVLKKLGHTDDAPSGILAVFRV